MIPAVHTIRKKLEITERLRILHNENPHKWYGYYINTMIKLMRMS
jgi:hypothetical protein